MFKKTLFLMFLVLSGCGSQPEPANPEKQEFINTHLLFDMSTEVEHVLCPIQGEIPAWLSGTLLRNGPAKFTVGDQRVSSWFDGLAMLHAFDFTPEKVFYSNRFIRSEQYHEMVDEGKMTFSGFAQDPCSKTFKDHTSRFFSKDKAEIENAVVSIAEYADQMVALTETPLPVVFDPITLETVGVFNYKDQLPKSDVFESAHPHHDVKNKETVNYLVRYGAKSSYVIWKMKDHSAERETMAEYSVYYPSYMHSFALTENYVILVEYPFIVNPLDLHKRDKPFIRNFYWEPELGTTFLVFDRALGHLVAKLKAESFFAFHHVNAFEKEGRILLDIVTYPNSYVIDRTTQKQKGQKNLNTELKRFTITPINKVLAQETLFSEPLEMPRIPAALDTHPYQYCYAIDALFPTSNDEQRPLYKIDTKNKTSMKWAAEGCAPGEPIFVPRPGGKDEDDGVVLSLILDYANHRSFLLILDAQSFKELARAEAPHAVPIGLHGLWQEPQK